MFSQTVHPEKLLPLVFYGYKLFRKRKKFGFLNKPREELLSPVFSQGSYCFRCSKLSSPPQFSSHLFDLLLKFHCKTYRFRCNGGNRTSDSSTKQDSEPQNALLKIAWYSSELLGIAASVFRPPSLEEAPERTLELAGDGSGAVDQPAVVASIKEDFEKSYFVTGNLTLNAYEEDCEFADPAGSFEGLQRFKRKCTNFGSLLVKSNMKLAKWEDFDDKGIGHWRFSCTLSLETRSFCLTMLIYAAATGYTEYYFDAQSGRVCRHVEHWNVPKMALFKQILKPSRGSGIGDQVSRWLKDMQVKL